jgi:hypothetical protein
MMRYSLLAIVLFLGARASAAQERRTLDVSRMLTDSVPHTVKVEFAVGRLDLRAAAPPLLYAMHVEYDERRADAVHKYDRASHTLEVGMPTQELHVNDRGEGGKRQGTLRLSLTRAVPLDLSLEMGAAEAELAFGGLSLSNLRVEGGASTARLAFDSLNPVAMRALELEVGAAGLRARGLANANTASIKVDGTVGDADLDFGGAWTQDVEVTADMIFGRLRFHVPRDVGVRLEVDRVFASVAGEGMSERGGAWMSENFESAPHKLRIRADVIFGTVRVERGTRQDPGR